MSTPTAEELLREAKDESYSRWWIVGEEQILAQRLATALARVAELEAEVQHRPTLTHLRCPKCDALPSWLESEGLWCDRGTPTHWIRCRSCGLQIRAVEWDELRQRAEAEERAHLATAERAEAAEAEVAGRLKDGTYGNPTWEEAVRHAEKVTTENRLLQHEITRMREAFDRELRENVAEDVGTQTIELRQRAEEAEAEAKAVSEHMSTVVLPDLVATADKLAEAQQREAWWREWYILGEMARMIGGAMPEVVERAKELRRILDATEGEK